LVFHIFPPLNDWLSPLSPEGPEPPAELKKVPEQHALPIYPACLNRFLNRLQRNRCDVLAVLIGGGAGVV